MAKRNYGAKDIATWRFEEPQLPQDWTDHLGELPIPFSMYVEGEGGHGKTEYIMMLSKMIARHIGKVHVNNVEQGKHKGIKMSHIRNRIAEDVPAGKWMYNDIRDFEEYKTKMKRDRPKAMIIDSISFWPLGTKEIQNLMAEFPRKTLVLVGYAVDSTKNKAIKHLCDIKVVVKDFKAYARGRFEGSKPFVISEEMHLSMMQSSRSKLHQTGNLFD